MPTVLLADTPEGLRQLVPVLDGLAEVVAAETYQEALDRCEEITPDAILVGYHFDDLRPYRLIQQLQDEACARGVTIILVRALALALSGSDTQDIRDAYRKLGADDFIDFFAERKRYGEERAAARLRERLLSPPDRPG